MSPQARWSSSIKVLPLTLKGVVTASLFVVISSCCSFVEPPPAVALVAVTALRTAQAQALSISNEGLSPCACQFLQPSRRVNRRQRFGFLLSLLVDMMDLTSIKTGKEL
jgi:hypothetical protein